MSIRLQDLLKARESGKDWWPLSSCKSGKIRVTAEWKPLNMAGSLHGVDQYVPPIGVVRLWLQKATDVKNVEATLGGKSDPYVRAQINNITQGRTEVVNNNLNPQWDQIIYIPVHSLKETMMLECMDYQHLTKDRSLGYVELKVSDLAQPSDGEFLYASTGKKEAAEPLRLDKGTFKGQLHYVAEFIPAYTLKGITFNTGPNELQRAVVPRSESDDGETVVDMEEETNMGVPEGITVAKPVDAEGKAEEQSNGENGHKKTNSSATSLSGVTAKTSNGETSSVNEKHAEDRAVEMSKDELLTHQSGVLIFNVISGQLHKKARLEVLLDDGYWPAFNTPRARSTNAVWEYIGEGFMKELDFGRVWLRLNEADEGDKDDIIAEWKGDAKPFLEKALDGPIDITLVDQDDEDKKSVVQIEARYIPVPIKLEPRESVNNQGMLRVDLLDGNGIHAVDRGGKSDPFVVFTLNGQKVYKSQTKKKTLSPEWNEDFIVQVPSRVGADFALEVFDWNQIEQAKSLGAGQIEVSDLEPFSATERTISLSSAKHGDKGAIRLRLLFTPEIIVRSRKNTSTFTSAGRAMTQIGHLPVGAGKGVLSGVTGVFKKDYAKHNGSVDSQVDAPSTIEPPAGQVSHPIFTTTPEGASAVPSVPSVPHDMASQGQSQDLGTLRVGVLDAKDLSINDSKPYVVLRVGDKEQKTKHVSSKASTPEWNETFAFSAAPATQPKMFVWVFDHKTLGKDKVLGSAEIDIWRHVQAGHGVSASDVAIELREGQGLLHLRLEFDPDTPLTRSRSRSSFHSGERTAPTSPSRFSLSLRRDRTD
ncbi:Uncharacterized protein PYUK71.03c [Grifola frondosa]|uniref:Uncharacterized protein PYUK71.03c n=1 Tax=Grifola frondosa TaxID=5627 RepID=A0A1C7MQU8_GRIFR|nr:Uncharacterized protein PYUK71.03c [Grifola frondosa]